ncbi:ribokinase [Streptomyces antibioticus]|uniref:Ribokinase n=1 Tax=Streptomyces antibioticus TaxID=1890 RepID=A0AAE6Y5N4_STRAT|nr:ribokinase [Streptomyces antibioticus]MCX4739774.1 ribokinase [Streptomyces antibioticus]MCX5168442.1 ribokinase [Streptomyces antibioticus]OOQ52811.1 ribokinase [Streptomyces antibioticus]QIT43965.1 ribokinase [Streptomyces antibioticus]
MTDIVVLGSTNMDLVAYVEKAPQRGETVTGREFRTIPGGKGANQAIAAAHAGGIVSMIGAVGNDSFGARLRSTLEHSGVNTDHLRTVESPSGTAHIVVDDEGGNAIVVVPGANGTVDHLAPGDEGLIASADALLLQLEVPLAAVVAGAEAARAHGVRTILTPAPARPLPPELLAAVDLLVPNEHEATALTGRTDPREAAAALLESVPEVVITLGAAGSLYLARGADPVEVPAPRVTAVDSTGAGDTFVGALAVARGEDLPMREALAWAAAAAALSVQRPGASAAMPYRSEIDKQYAS